jgi:hypothetical protein
MEFNGWSEISELEGEPVYLDGDTRDGYVIVGKDGEMLTSRGRTPVEAAQDFVLEKLGKWLKSPA